MGWYDDEEYSNDFKKAQLAEYGIWAFFSGFAFATFVAASVGTSSLILKLFLAVCVYLFMRFSVNALVKLVILMKIPIGKN